MDQRAHPRVPLVLPARLYYMGAMRECVVTDLSSSGAGLQFEEKAPTRELISSLDIQGFGIFEGVTIRDQGMSSGMRFLHGEAERNVLLQKLVMFIKRGISCQNDDPMLRRQASLRLAANNGSAETCLVQGVSLRGVSLATKMRPPIGELVRLGRMYGRVAAHQDDGIGVLFVSIVGPDTAGGGTHTDRYSLPALSINA